MKQLCGGLLNIPRRSTYRNGFESSGGARDDLEEGVVGGKDFVSLQLHIDGGDSRAVEVYKGLVNVFAIEIGPQC